MVRRPVDEPANALLDITIAPAPAPLARFKAGCQPFPEQADDTTPGHRDDDALIATLAAQQIAYVPFSRSAVSRRCSRIR